MSPAIARRDRPRTDEVAEGRGLAECAPIIAFVAVSIILAPVLVKYQITGLFLTAGNSLR